MGDRRPGSFPPDIEDEERVVFCRICCFTAKRIRSDGTIYESLFNFKVCGQADMP